MNNQLVSVIIPTYKRPSGLKKAIESVLEQSYEEIEIVVVDDNNPDTLYREQTEKVLSEFKDLPNIKYIKHSRNLNGSIARNTGIQNSTGEYIAFLDNDDFFKKDKVKLQVAKLKSKGKEYGVVYTKFIRKNNNILIDKGIENREGCLTLEILKGTFYISAGSNLLVRRELVDKISGFNPNFKRRQDLEFLLRLSEETKIAHVDEYCLVINKDDRTNELKASTNNYQKNKDEYINLFKGLINKQNTKDKKKILISLELPELRSKIIKFKILDIYKICKEKNIPILIVIKYVIYLAKRKTLKQCYGFKI